MTSASHALEGSTVLALPYLCPLDSALRGECKIKPIKPLHIIRETFLKLTSLFALVFFLKDFIALRKQQCPCLLMGPQETFAHRVITVRMEPLDRCHVIGGHL